MPDDSDSRREGGFHDQVEQLLFECLEQPGDERQRALEELCRVHPELAQPLRARFMRIDELGLVAEAGAPLAAAPESFGRYRIVRALGSGGMGVVYLAEDPVLGRRVALKLIRSEHLPFTRARERFRREALLASRLDHPCICSVYEAGEVDGTPFLTMRYIEGETLDARLRRVRQAGGAASVGDGLAAPPGSQSGSQVGSASREPGATRADPRGLERLLWMFERLAHALHAAHEVGLVHRDVKPGNVMLTPSGDPVLLDFGLALDENAEPGLTLSGDRIGTPAYMAPEQVRGGTAPDRRADVYGLAATLYECLTLRCPFVADRREELYRLILTTEPADPRRHDRRIGRDLRAVLEKALDKDLNRRYASAAELAEELRRVRAHEPVLARRTGPLLRTRRWCQRNPLAAALVTVLVVASTVSWLLLVENRSAALRKDASMLANFAREVSGSDAMLGLLAAQAAHERAPGRLDTISAVYDALARSHEVRRFDEHKRAVWKVLFSVDQTKVVSAGVDGFAYVRDVQGTVPAIPLEHDGSVYDVDLHAGLVVTATARNDRRPSHVRLWDLEGHLIATAPFPERPGQLANMFLRARFSHDGKRILALSQGGPAWIWEPASNGLVELVGHRGMVFHGEFSPDDSLVATCVGWGSEIIPPNTEHRGCIWRASDGHLVAELKGHTDSLLWIEFAPDGKSLLTASQDKTVRVWDLEGRQLQLLSGHRAGVRVARFHPHAGRGLIASGSFDGDLRLWNTAGAEVEVIATMPQGEPIWDLEFSRDGGRLLSASYGRTASIYDLRGRCLRILRGHGDKIMDATFSPDGRLVVTGSWDGTVRLWRAEEEEFSVLAEHDGAIRSLDCSRDGWLLSASTDGTVRLRHQGQCTVMPLGSRVNRALFARSDESVLTVQDDQTVAVWSIQGAPRGRWKATEQELYSGELPGWRNCTVAFVREDRFLVAAQSHEVRLFDTSGRSTRIAAPVLDASVHEFTDIAAHREGQYFATGAANGAMKVWNLDGHVLETHDAHRGNVVRVEFSRDGKRLLSASKDSTAILWEFHEGELHKARTLTHEAGLTWATFDSSGDHVLTTAVDGTAHLWSSSGVEIAALRMADVPLTCAAFRPDGSGFFVGTEHGLILSCPMPAQAIALAQQRASRPMSAEERLRIESRLGR